MTSTNSKAKPIVRAWPAPKFPLVLDAADFMALQVGDAPDFRPRGFVETLKQIVKVRDSHETFGHGLLDQCDPETMIQVMLERAFDGTHRNDRIAFSIARDLDARYPIRLPALIGGAQ